MEPRQILAWVATNHGYSVAQLKGPRRHREVSYFRAIAIYLIRRYCKLSLPQTGAEMGGRDHTSILAAERKIKKLIEEDDEKTIRVVESFDPHHAVGDFGGDLRKVIMYAQRIGPEEPPTPRTIARAIAQLAGASK